MENHKVITELFFLIKSEVEGISSNFFDLLKSEFEDISSNFPSNLPLYKDSGSWQLRTEDMEDVIEQQGVNESFYEFLTRISGEQLRKDFEQEVVK
jgi:hypothetical protein